MTVFDPTILKYSELGLDIYLCLTAQLHANLGGLTSWVGNEESDKTHTDTAAPKSRTDANAEHWRSGNVRLYDELQGLIWPSRGLWHSTYVDWQAIYPARVLEHPEDFEYGLFPYNP
eukprot:COSAG05_NODE_2682_length_2773_cov_2614.172775_3_plen_117_part_00